MFNVPVDGTVPQGKGNSFDNTSTSVSSTPHQKTSNTPVSEQLGINDIVTQGKANSAGNILPIVTSTYRVKTSEKIYTEGYQNDPIEFDADARFLPGQITAILPYLPNQCERDLASYIEVNITSGVVQYVPVGLYSPMYNAANYNRAFATRKQFTQFGV